MGFVTSIFPRRIIQAAGGEIDARAMLRSIGLEPDGELDVTERVGEQAYYDLLERIVAQMEHGEELPLKVGSLMRPDDYGALGLAWKSAPSIRASQERVLRFCQLCTDNMTYELRDVPGGAEYVLHRFGDRRLGLRLSNESTLTSTTSLIRQTSSARFRPEAVFVQHGPPRSTAAHLRYFGCPVHFGASRDALRISDRALSTPNHLADEGIFRYVSGHLEKAIEDVEGPAEGIETLVRRAVSRSLSDGVPRMAVIAKRLAMSERTLQRRLAHADLSFKGLVDTTRRQLAETLLRQREYSLSDVAFLTGFSEHSAFTRAFKRWAGQTPRAFRKERMAAR
ncbi:MAG: AraC family transcriptional regulator ligand-binding domain-containing protein [Myxococcota bacterium]